MPTQRCEEKRAGERASTWVCGGGGVGVLGKWEGGRGGESPLAPLFMFFPSPGPALCKWAWPGVLIDLKSSLQSPDLLLFYFCELFPSLSFSHHHFGLLFPILTT